MFLANRREVLARDKRIRIVVSPMTLYTMVFKAFTSTVLHLYFRGLLGEIAEVIINLRTGQDAGGQAGEDAA